MEKCTNCLKEYTLRGIKLHKRKCDPIYFLIKKKEEEKLEKEKNKIKIYYSPSNNLTLGNYLPDDCIKIIYQFLMLKDNHISFFKLYKYINNISFVCKNFYINKPNMELIKKNIPLELKENICRSWSIKNYGLTNDDLEVLNYHILSCKFGMTVHLFNLVEIKNLAYKKYGTEYDYHNYLIKKNHIKSLSKKEKDIIFNKRKDIYQSLFSKYNFSNNSFLISLYPFYLKNFIKKGIPRLDTIEEEIKWNEDKLYLKNNLVQKLDILNIKYLETEEVLFYINKIKNYTEENAILSLQICIQKEEEFLHFINKNNYDLEEYIEIGNEFIKDSTRNIDSLFLIIHNCEIIKKYMDTLFSIKQLKNREIKDIQKHIIDIVDKWCNNNKEKQLDDFNFISEFDPSVQLLIKKKFNIFDQEKNINLSKKIERDKIINRFKTKNKFDNNLFCYCDNLASIKCIEFICKTCCKNKNCKKHFP